MDAAAYRSLRDLQDQHWWFVGRRNIIADLIHRCISLPKQPQILEAGCGYGGNLAMLAQFGNLNAFEFEDGARAYASTLLKQPVTYGSLPDNVGFDDESFDLVAILDVLEHIDDDIGSLSALGERLNDNGSILITVPALPWLWSEHDESHHHKRRYTKASLTKVLQSAGFELENIGYFNTLLFPLALIQRIALKLFGSKNTTNNMPGGFVNDLFSKIFTFERRLVGRVNLPVGLSLYAVARRARR